MTIPVKLLSLGKGSRGGGWGDGGREGSGEIHGIYGKFLMLSPPGNSDTNLPVHS